MGLRYLFANMGELQSNTTLLEFTIDHRPIDIVETLLMDNLGVTHAVINTSETNTSTPQQQKHGNTKPDIIGFGVYIWNVEKTTEVITLIKSISPETIIVIGGPEVSYEPMKQTVVALADYVISGSADLSFRRLCEKIWAGERPLNKMITSPTVPLASISLPYRYYSDQDIANRVLYVEASRGCPFKCEFCLSALDKTAWPFELKLFLEEMALLYKRGARHFKFVDRTFNLKIESSVKILEFFLQRLSDDLFLHFELIPDHLPDQLKAIIEKFPLGSLQFEIGIQSFNTDVQKHISRKQNTDKAIQNLQWLRTKTNAYLHTDLIIGLPGEDIASFAQGFNMLAKLKPHEIQIGILKRLRGTPIIRHSETFKIKYNTYPPYNVLCSDRIDFKTMQQLSRFARYWDIIANSGRFTESLPLLLGNSPFEHFFQLSNWLYHRTRQTHRLALPRLFELLYTGLVECLQIKPQHAADALWLDYQKTKLKSHPSFITTKSPIKKQSQALTRNRADKRQSRHRQPPPAT